MNRVLFSIVIVLVACIAAPLSADQRKGNGNASGNNNETPRVEAKSSLTDSVRRVELQTGGEVLSAEPMQRDGRQISRVKVLTTDGRVRVMQVEPQQTRSKKNQPPPRTQNATDDKNDKIDKDGGDPDLF